MIKSISKDLLAYYNTTPKVRAGFKMGAFLAIICSVPVALNLVSQYFTAQQVATGMGCLTVTILLVMIYQVLLSREEHSQAIRDMLRKHNDVY